MAQKKLEGIRGWLLLLTVNLVLASLAYFGAATLSFVVLFLTAERQSLGAFLMFSGMSVATIYVLNLERQHSHLFPSHCMILMWAALILAFMFSKPTPFLLLNTVLVVLWTLYLYRSRRVANTFTQ